MPPESPDPIFHFHIEDIVTNVGLRLAIANIIPDELELRVDNLNRHKVRVYLQGDERAIERFYNRIKKRKTLGKAKKFTISEISPIDMQGCFSIDTNRFFHKLECEQMGKFVDVGIEMRDEIKGMRKEMGGVRGEIGGMRKEMKDLPKNLARELKKVLK